MNSCLILPAGTIEVQQSSTEPLEHYDIPGYLCVGLMFLCIGLLYSIHKHVEHKMRVPAKSPGEAQQWKDRMLFEG